MRARSTDSRSLSLVVSISRSRAAVSLEISALRWARWMETSASCSKRAYSVSRWISSERF